MADIRMAHVSFGGREYAVVTFRDAGERLHAEQASRMASLGSLAAGVAHEINNPLAFVAANLDHAAAELRCRTGADGSIAVEPAAAKELAEALADASEGARRVKEVVRSLHVFSRPSEGQAAPVSVEAELRAALSLADNEIRHRARVEARIDPVPPVVAGAHELGQVFLNLLVNAAQAIPEGHRQENAIRIECRRAADGQVLVEIADSGVGISPDRLPRIFEPFYTTKPGSGTGLGLSICHGVVTRLGGRIAVDSQAGRGSTFRVFLPPAPAAAEPAEAAAVTPDPLPGRLRLLVVDDEESVGRALGRILGGRHQVAAVTSAREALERIERGEQFDGVVCDLMMPEMSGIDLHRALTRSAPRLAERMVLMTGGAFTPAAQEFLSESHIPCVEKPFEADALLEALARAVAR
jgi:nitrogen-specific signal transduction histidine kinase/CheY-like chemotaxis protein